MIEATFRCRPPTLTFYSQKEKIWSIISFFSIASIGYINREGNIIFLIFFVFKRQVTPLEYFNERSNAECLCEITEAHGIFLHYSRAEKDEQGKVAKTEDELFKKYSVNILFSEQIIHARYVKKQLQKISGMPGLSLCQLLSFLKLT